MGEKLEPKEGLQALRQGIDEVDRRLLALLNERAKLALEVGKLKSSLRASPYAPSREEDLLRRLQELNPGPFPTSAIRPVWKEIISASLSLEAPLLVAYLGPQATFTHQACLRQFGLSAHYRPERTISEVFDAVQKGKAAYGVIPIENTTEGVVSYTLDMFLVSELKIVAEVFLPITHHLLNRSGSREDVGRIYSHPQALAQCRRWLEKNLPDVPVLDATSTAQAAKIAAEEPEAAAIAGELAGSLYGLKTVEARIEDNPNNITRFLVIGREIPDRGSRNKTSLLFAVKDQVGALYRMLQPFYDNGVNLTKIESRPLKQKAWEYVFFVDLEGHVTEDAVHRALEGLAGHCQFVKVLGSYPVGNSG
ncbi:MAG: prephenate dehydratase [Deltaproteobacteria bacterium]|nr:prephenate dehydratase [Deltaproteobacteria bacterium]